MSDWDDDILSEDKADDGIIELIDIVDEGPGDTDEETIIELTEITQEEDSDLDLDIAEEKPADLSLDIEEDDDIRPEKDEEEIADFDLDIIKEENDVDFDSPEADLSGADDSDMADLGLELEIDDGSQSDSDDGTEEIPSVQEPSVSEEQVEAALERVIEKKFGDKIETILFEVLERVIEKEIVEIKENLQQDLDHIGNV